MLSKDGSCDKYEVVSESQGVLYSGHSLKSALNILKQRNAHCTKHGLVNDTLFYRGGDPMSIVESGDGKLSFESE